jgi:hypothetical protein
MSVIREVLSDLLLPDSIDWQRDRVVFNRRRHDRQGLGQGWLILAALLLLAGWLVIGAMLPDPKATLYKYETPWLWRAVRGTKAPPRAPPAPSSPNKFTAWREISGKTSPDNPCALPSRRVKFNPKRMKRLAIKACAKSIIAAKKDKTMITVNTFIAVRGSRSGFPFIQHFVRISDTHGSASYRAASETEAIQSATAVFKAIKTAHSGDEIILGDAQVQDLTTE